MTVNHFDTVFGLSCWDMHADGGGLNNTYLDYERHLCPQFDLAFTALIDGPRTARPAEGDGRGGAERVRPDAARQRPRRPRPLSGGLDQLPLRRQHPRRPGHRLDRQDRLAPNDTPIEPPQVLASIYQGMGINLDTTMMPGPGGRPVRLIEAEPIRQLFA